ncbi:equilibrative nucleoside transporter 3-like isoform X1 [Artemia franciscana]|uniref:equilibrative nucleoside transporter 3-like isoform X1 n=2 Tax=Artemia franciscana TaxID=6661 RepID=UPI0032DB733F
MSSKPVEIVAYNQIHEPDGDVENGTVMETEYFDEERPENITDDTPTDRWNIVYIFFILLGVGIVMPWNMFIMAKEYFVNKLEGSEYLHNFFLLLTLLSQIPNMALQWMNLVVSFGGSVTKRVTICITVMILVFTGTIILIFVDTAKYTFL